MSPTLTFKESGDPILAALFPSSLSVPLPNFSFPGIFGIAVSALLAGKTADAIQTFTLTPATDTRAATLTETLTFDISLLTFSKTFAVYSKTEQFSSLEASIASEFIPSGTATIEGTITF